jgi:cupin 2 domain-containing protein
MKSTGNLFELDQDPQKGKPQIFTAGHHAGIVVTRTVSIDYATPHGAWLYCGDGGAMIMILSGEVGILVSGEGAPHILTAGEYLEVAATKGYRIEWTHPSTPTVWLTIGRRQFVEISEEGVRGTASIAADDSLLQRMTAEDLFYLHMTGSSIAECS